jgi:hypothetical protein
VYVFDLENKQQINKTDVWYKSAENIGWRKKYPECAYEEWLKKFGF